MGHAGIKRIMAEQDAVAGVEHSAHYYFRDFFFADSGMLAALHVLAALAESEGSASQLVAAHSPYAHSGELNFPVDDAAAAEQRVRAHVAGLPAARLDELDGLIVRHWDESLAPEDRWWLSLRSSQTEALLRLNVEAEQPGTMERVRDEILALVRGPGPETVSTKEAPVAEASADVTTLADVPVSAAGHPLPAGASGADVPSWVREVLRCPDCGGELQDVDAAMQCIDCRRVHPVEGGIPVLIAGRHEAPAEG